MKILTSLESMLVGWLLGFHLFGFGFLVFLVGGLGFVCFFLCFSTLKLCKFKSVSFHCSVFAQFKEVEPAFEKQHSILTDKE